MECRAFSDVCRCMKARKEGVAIWRLDEKRYAISVDQVIRYVGSQEECQRRAEILLPKDNRKEQDNALILPILLMRSGRHMECVARRC